MVEMNDKILVKQLKDITFEQFTDLVKQDLADKWKKDFQKEVEKFYVEKPNKKVYTSIVNIRNKLVGTSNLIFEEFDAYVLGVADRFQFMQNPKNPDGKSPDRSRPNGTRILALKDDNTLMMCDSWGSNCPALRSKYTFKGKFDEKWNTFNIRGEPEPIAEKQISIEEIKQRISYVTDFSEFDKIENGKYVNERKPYLIKVKLMDRLRSSFGLPFYEDVPITLVDSKANKDFRRKGLNFQVDGLSERGEKITLTFESRTFGSMYFDDVIDDDDMSEVVNTQELDREKLLTDRLSQLVVYCVGFLSKVNKKISNVTGKEVIYRQFFTMMVWAGMPNEFVEVSSEVQFQNMSPVKNVKTEILDLLHLVPELTVAQILGQLSEYPEDVVRQTLLDLSKENEIVYDIRAETVRLMK